jgi:hypothetical protein
MIHEALEWLGAHPEALADIEPVSYDWREIGEAIGMLGEMSDDTVDYIGKMPEVMRNLLISVLASGSRGDATVRTSWTPSYDWTMTISKANFGEGPEYHVALGSKYPPEVMGLD